MSPVRSRKARTFREAPTGAIDGENKTFSLQFTPKPETEDCYVNGILQIPGVDYTINGDNITMTVAPSAGVDSGPSDFLWTRYQR